MPKSFISVIIVASGTGTRMASLRPKQFLEIDGVEIIEHTVFKFINSCVADEIVIVCHKDYIEHTKELFIDIDFNIKIVEGSDTRQKSVCCGLKVLDEKCEYVMIHDAVRCCVEPEYIKLVAKGLPEKKACALGVKVNDTVKRADENAAILETVDRNNLWLIQTPQAFEISLIKTAHENARINNYEATDDCAVAEYAGYPVYIIEGSYKNIKVTTPVDLIIAGEYLKG